MFSIAIYFNANANMEELTGLCGCPRRPVGHYMTRFKPLRREKLMQRRDSVRSYLVGCIEWGPITIRT